jgi:hypothetical protein
MFPLGLGLTRIVIFIYYFLYLVYLTTLSVALTIQASNDGMNNELERM